MIALQVLPRASATAAALGLPNDAVAHWSFEEGTGTTTADVSGNGHTGTLVNGASWAIGQLGNAVSLDGVGDYVEVADPGPGSNLDFSNNDTITITAWAKRNSTGGWQPIVNKYAGAGNQRNYELSFSGGGLNTTPDSMAFVFQATTGVWLVFSSDTTYADSNWHHFVIVHTFGDSASTKMYVDGALASASWKFGAGNEEAHVGDGALRIGATEIATERFNGSIDDVRIFRRALSPIEVGDLFTGGGTPQSVASLSIGAQAPVEVIISTTTIGATIHYTTDGSEPTTASAQYTGPLFLTSSATVKAKAYRTGMEPSGETTTSFTVTGDTTPPTIDSATAAGSGNQAMVVFSEAMDSTTANNPGNYAISPGITVSAASLGSDSKTVTLTISTLSTGTAYTLTVNNVMDQSGNPILPDSQVNLFFISSDLTIDIWYGSQQKFGNVGISQVWADILGNVSPAGDVVSLTFSLNGGTEQSLNIGPDDRRLVTAGDFNAQIPITDLVPGLNSVVITATDTSGQQTQATVIADYTAGNVWPASYEVDWSTVTDIQDVAQIVDGVWTVDPQGIRTLQIGYDRLFAIGDVTWEDYEVEFPMTVHNSISINGGAGVIIRWQGHTNGGAFCEQPVCGWVPYGNEVWYRWTDSGGVSSNFGGTLQENSGRVLQYDVPYIYKVRVESVEGQDALYSMKVWEQGQPEPADWDAQGLGTQGVEAGSILFIAHLTDVTIGNIKIVPLGAPVIEPNGGTFDGSVEVTLSTTIIGGTIRYTTDGSTPVNTSAEYTAPFVLTSSATVKAKTFKTGEDPSAESSATFVVLSDTTPPNIVGATAFEDPNLVSVVFDEPLDPATANNAGNYAISDGVNNVAVSAANLGGDSKTVTLTTGLLVVNTTYTLTVSNVEDESGNVIAANSETTFQFDQVNVADGLAAYWSFDEGAGLTTDDLSGNGHTGALVNGASWAIGQFGTAVSLDGFDDYVEVTDPGAGSNLDFGIGDTITITAWAKRNSTGGWQPIVNKNGSFANQRNYELGYSGGGLNTASDSVVFVFQATSNDWVAFSSDATYADLNWHHIVLVHTFGDSASTKLYVDGAQVSASWKFGAGNEEAYVGDGPLRIGATEIARERLDGLVDDLRIYRRALTAGEIQTLSAAP